jgi:phage terminase large subunit GpA-like protein
VSAWWHGFGGVVVDYGIAEVINTDRSMTNEASEAAIYQALLNWRDELLCKDFIDSAGNKIPVQFAMVDSGTFTNAAYQFVRDVGGVFHVSKGINPYHRKKESNSNLIAGENLHAAKLPASKVWLYELDTSYWKQFIHERFMTPTFDESNMLRRGSLSLFQDESMSHISYSNHITAEELLTVFKEGKGLKTYWHPKSENNHWLDATYMSAAAGEALGVKLIGASEVEIKPRQVEQGQQKQVGNSYRHGTTFRNSSGASKWQNRRNS